MDPSRFPTDTRLRVGLILVALSTVGLFFADVLNLPDQAAADDACMQTAWTAVPTVRTAADAARWERAWTECRGPAQRSAGIGLAGGLDFLFIAVGVYATQVSWRLRRRGMRPLEGALLGPVSAAVREHATAAGLPRTPHIYLDVRAGATPSVFGKASQPILAVGQGTLVDFASNRPRFDAVIHHELFHLRGNDVRTYYRALAVFRAMVAQSTAFALIIVGGLIVLVGEPAEALTVAVQFVVIVALGFATLRDYLRRREFHADMWAVDRTGDSATVKSALRPARAPRRGDRVLQAFHSHPTAAERIRALHDRRRALTFSSGAAFLTSAAVGLLGPTLALFLPLLGVYWINAHRHAIAGAVCGVVLGRVLAIGVWRNAHLDLIAGTRVRRGLGVGLSAAGGLLVGGLLPLHLVFDRGGPGIPLSVAQVTGVVVGVTAFCGWAAFCARLRLGAHPDRLDQRAYRWGLRVASVVAGGLLAAVYFRAGLIRGRHSYDALGGSDLPRLDASKLLTESQLDRAFLAGLLHDWRAYVIVGLAVAWPAVARAAGWRRPPEAARPLPTRSEAPGPAPTPASAAATRAIVADEPVTAIAAGARGPERSWVVFATAGAAVAALIAATGRTPALLFVVVIAVAALLLAWFAYLGRKPSKPLLTGVYSAAAVTGVLVTVPFGHYEDLSLIVVGLAGTAIYSWLGLPVPGNRHVLILLSAGLILHHRLWVLLTWLVVGPLIGLLLHRVLNRPAGELEPPLWLGMAIGGVAAMGLEAFLA
jgi:Zn-dependent protease with chaperone function